MSRSRIRANANAGFTMIEIMIAGGLVAFMAVALLPAVLSTAESGKVTGFKAQCSAMVRTKLQDYINGVSDSQQSRLDATTGTSVYYKPSGFEYTKQRWRQFGSSSCTDQPMAELGPAGPGGIMLGGFQAPGFRESINGNTGNYNAEETVDGTTVALGGTRLLSRELLGFQLYVLIRPFNPRSLVSGQPSRACTGDPSNPINANYQFGRVGDALEVTVTGMIRTDVATDAGGRGCKPVGKVYDKYHRDGCPVADGATIPQTVPNQELTCSATEIIYPPRVPFRYYIGADGKMRNLLAATAVNAGVPGATTEAAEAHFRAVWAPSGVTSANIRSFAVAPDNRYVWLLKPAELSLYGPCADTSVTVGAVTTDGAPECPSTPIAKYNTDPNVENMTVDFGDLTTPSDDKVFGFYNSGSTDGKLLQATLGSGVATWAPTTSFFRLPPNRPRIKGMFLAQTFPSVDLPRLFFFDNNCFNSGSGSTGDLNYCTSIFSSSDSNMNQEMRELPMQVESISF